MWLLRVYRLVMTHDPMCPVLKPTQSERRNAAPMLDLLCACDLIARVREDERDLFFSQRDRLASEVDKAKIAGWHAGRKEGYAAALRDAAEAVKAALDAGLATSTDKALYFFEADKDDPTLGYDVTFHKDSLVAAIEALGGER